MNAEKIAAGRNGSSRLSFEQDGEGVIVRAKSTDRADGETLWSRFCAFKVSGYDVRFLDGCAPEPADRVDDDATLRLRGKYHRVNTRNAMAFSVRKA